VTDLVGHDPSPLAERRRAQLLSNHALGLLSESEARDLEAHLAGCAQCCQDWEAIRATMDLVGENIPEEFFDTTRADSTDLIFQSTLRAVRREKRAKTWHRLLRPVVAAAVLLVALAGVLGGVVGRATAPAGPSIVQAEGAHTVQGTGVGGATMRATVAPAGQWVRLAVTASGFPRGARCRLMVVAADGQREPAGSWTVPAAGPEGGVSVAGSAAVPMSQVRAVAVETDGGQELIYVQV
jgi:hypothetical protein